MRYKVKWLMSIDKPKRALLCILIKQYTGLIYCSKVMSCVFVTNIVILSKLSYCDSSVEIDFDIIGYCSICLFFFFLLQKNQPN